LKEIVNSVNIPCIAIGGIDENNAAEVAKTGVDGVAMISAIVTKDDVEEAVSKIGKDFYRAKKTKRFLNKELTSA